MLLAVGGSLVAAQPASAAVITNTPTLAGGSAHIQSGMQYISLQVSGCTFSAGTPTFGDFSLTNVGGTQTLSTVTITGGGYLQFVLSANLAGGEHLTFTYTPGGTPISCGGGNTLGAITFDDSVPVPASITGTPSVGASASTVTATPATVVGGIASKYWFVCSSAKSATATSLSGAPIDAIAGCSMLFNTAGTSSAVSTDSLSLTGTFYTRAGSLGSYTYPVATFAGKQVIFAQVLGMTIAYSSSVSGDITTVAPLVSSVVSEAAKPLPVWAAPILKQIPTLSKTLTTDGGKIALKDGDYSSLKSVTVGGKEVAYSIDAKGDVNIPVPAGKGGTTADLVVVFTGGKMTVQDGIKYVEPTNVAAVREAPIAGFKGNSTKITGALAETIQYAAQLDKKANTVLCTGYAASKAAVATATARAEAACGYATKVNDLLVNKKVTIVVNAKLAKTAAVGIKVYK